MTNLNYQKFKLPSLDNDARSIVSQMYILVMRKHCKFTEAFPITSFNLKTIYMKNSESQKSSKMKR